MKSIRVVMLVLFCGGLFGLASCSPPMIVVPPEDAQLLVEGNNQFAFDLYKKIAEKETGNIIFSPYSISSALTMTYAGARGTTADEMRATLRYQLPDDRLHVAMGGGMQQLQSGKRFQLSVANSLWGQTGMGFRPEFLALTKEYYDGGFRELDFAADPNGARQTINRWIEQKTQDRIKDMLGSEDITSNTALVLANAIYFKGQWVEPFERTIDGIFEPSPGVKQTVPMMHAEKKFGYHKSDDFEILELPYQGDRVSMVVLLPNTRFGLADVEKTLTQAKFAAAIAKLSQRTVTVVLPKFKTTYRMELKDAFTELGMPTAFTPSADFTGMLPGGGLKIAKVIHKADIEVDEKGTVAAAATAVSLQFSGTLITLGVTQWCCESGSRSPAGWL